MVDNTTTETVRFDVEEQDINYGLEPSLTTKIDINVPSELYETAWDEATQQDAGPTIDAIRDQLYDRIEFDTTFFVNGEPIDTPLDKV